MTDVAIVAAAQTEVGEHWSAGLRDLGSDVIGQVLDTAAGLRPDLMIVANAFGSTMSSQSQLGPLLASISGLTGVETFTVEAGDASGGAALRAAYLAVQSGAVETALVVGVEKSTDSIASARVAARSVALDADFEAAHGLTLSAQAGLVMRRYMHEYGVGLEAFEGFSINAHANGRTNPRAMFRNALKPGAFSKAGMVADPVTLFDGAPDADGAAAVLLTRVRNTASGKVVIAGSGGASDSLAIHNRKTLLSLEAVTKSTRAALAQAEASLEQIDLFELHDSFTIASVLAIEAIGLAEAGNGWRLAADSGTRLRPTGDVPMSTFGGLKARGNPVGATGVYQAVEAYTQLMGLAGDNQVPDAEFALIQSVGGFGASVFTHVLRRTD
ncbi:MAG: hypothetical protein IPM16_06115 [Chloroflexi bacterium]|nr:hypothetical protein [Chloroflexota bacterium]